MPCCIRMSPVMYIIFIYAIYMLMVFPITELICFVIRNYTDIDPQHHYQISRWIYLGLLITFMPFYFLTFYISWRRNRAKPLFTPNWKVSDDLDEDDFMCTICYDLVVEPHTLRCQHSFCKKCINQCLRLTRKCPSCQQWVYLCSPNSLMKEKLLKWIEKEGRQDEYEEVVQMKQTMRVEKVGLLANLCNMFQPFFEIPDPHPIRLRPRRRARQAKRTEPAAALVVAVVDESEPLPANPEANDLTIEMISEPVQHGN